MSKKRRSKIMKVVAEVVANLVLGSVVCASMLGVIGYFLLCIPPM